MLEFNIRNQEISRIDNFSPAEKSVEYLIAKFNFKTEDWNEAIKRAVFRNVKSKVEKDTMIEDDSCVVPWEVLVGSGDIEVSVHGVIGTEEITTDVAVFNLNRTLQGGSVTQEPSPTVYAQMVEMVKDAKEVAQSVRTDAYNGKFNGAKGDKGKDGKSAYDYAVEGGFEGTEQEFIDLMAQAGQVDLTGYVTKEEHEAELLKAFVKVTTEKAAYHHITDSANYRVLDFGMEGLTEQPTTGGHQLFDFKSDKWSTSIGSTAKTFATVTLVDDGFKIVNNVTDSNLYLSVYYEVDVEPDTVYQLKGKHNRNYPLAVYNSEGTKISSDITANGTSIGSFISPSDGKIYIMFGTTRGVLANNDSTYTEVMLAVDASVYEKYTGRIPSPNPEYEQPITLAGVLNEETGRYEHKCCVGNKNVFDESKLSNGEFVEFNGVRCYKYTDGKASMITYDGFFALNAQYTITIRIYRESDDVTKNSFFVAEYTDGTSQKIKCFSNETTIFTSPTDKSIKRITSHPFYGLPAYLDLSVMQIEVGEVSTAYTPHASQPFTLTSDRPLTKWDNLVKVDGKWYWDCKQLKLIVDGTSDWYYYDDYKGFRVLCLPEKMGRREGYCNQLRNDTKGYSVSGVRNHMWLGVANIVLYALNVDYYDESLEDKGLANWKAHLNEHPLEIYTYKDESELVPLLDEEQELLRNLEMYYGVTNIYNEQGCPISITYCADQELHWNQKLLQIQQAII